MNRQVSKMLSMENQGLPAGTPRNTGNSLSQVPPHTPFAPMVVPPAGGQDQPSAVDTADICVGDHTGSQFPAWCVLCGSRTRVVFRTFVFPRVLPTSLRPPCSAR